MGQNSLRDVFADYNRKKKKKKTFRDFSATEDVTIQILGLKMNLSEVLCFAKQAAIVKQRQVWMGKSKAYGLGHII